MKKHKYIIIIFCIFLLSTILVGCDPQADRTISDVISEGSTCQYQYTGDDADKLADFDWTIDSSGLSSEDEEYVNKMMEKGDEYSNLGDSPNYAKRELLLPNGRTIKVFVDADKAFEQGCKDFEDVFSTIKHCEGFLFSISKNNYKNYLALISGYPAADRASARRIAQASNFLGTYDLTRMYT